MTQRSLFDAPPAAEPDAGDWTPLELHGRPYRWRLRPELLGEDLGPETFNERSGFFEPRPAFQLEYVSEDHGWREVRFYTRRIQAWAIVRELPWVVTP